MQERALLLGGELTIGDAAKVVAAGAEGQGTIVRVRIPLSGAHDGGQSV